MSVKFINVSHIYSPKTPFEHTALTDINLEIKEGSFTAIVGHTGSGKSTLIQHINALLKPSKGKVKVDEFVITNDSKTKNIKFLRKHAGIVFQFPEYQLFESTVEKDVMFGPLNFGSSEEDAKEKAYKALAMVGIPASYYQKSPFELSGGEKRRVAIAGILAMEPRILVLDEPVAGLDPQGIEEIMNLFKKIHENGVTVILVSHDMDVVLKYASDVVIMDEGRIIKTCKPFELFADPDFEKYSLDMPLVYKFALKLKENGLDIDLTSIRTIEELVYAIKERRSKL